MSKLPGGSAFQTRPSTNTDWQANIPASKIPGTILNAKRKGAVCWQARISHDRNRLEVVGVIEPSNVPITFALLEEHELLELLGEGAELDDRLERGR